MQHLIVDGVQCTTLTIILFDYVFVQIIKNYIFKK